MDEQYVTKMASSFLEELTEIEKQGFNPLGFLASGARGLGRGLMNIGKPGGFAAGLAGKGGARHGGMWQHAKKIWGAGEQKALKQGKSSFMGGLGALGRSRYGQMAGAAAVPLVAGYGVHKLTS